MSSDQRPGKVRVFSSGPNGDALQRRRTDREDAETAALEAPLPEARAALKGTGRLPLLSILFLLGCALGGILLAWFGLMPGQTR